MKENVCEREKETSDNLMNTGWDKSWLRVVYMENIQQLINSNTSINSVFHIQL